VGIQIIIDFQNYFSEYPTYLWFWALRTLWVSQNYIFDCEHYEFCGYPNYFFILSTIFVGG
jgi:hypothetical protein